MNLARFLIPVIGIFYSGISVYAESLDEIVVTAGRRPESAADLAASAASIPGTELKTVAAVHPAELLNRIAGINLNRGNGQEHLTAIRSPVLTGGAGAGSFLFLEDSIPLRAAGFANINGLFEANTEIADRVEVFRGPGSILHGSNALHGLINIITPDPSSAVSNWSLWAGPHDYTTASGTVSLGKLLLAGNLSRDGGYRADSGYDQQKLLARYKVQSDNWIIGTKLSMQNLNQETADYVVGEQAYKDPVLSKSNANPEAFRDARSIRAALTADRLLENGNTLSINAYYRATDMEFLMHFVPGQALEENGHHSIGLINSLYIDNDQAGYIIGFDVEYSSGFLRETQQQETVFSFVQGKHYDYDVTALVASPYISGDWWLSDRTHIQAGLRFDYTHYAYTNNMDTGTSGRFLRLADRADEYRTITPGFSVLRKIDESLNAYLRLARGTRAPQTTDLYRLQANQQTGEIKPETLDMLEIGVKRSAATLNWNIAMFTMRKNHFFFRDADGFNATNGKTRHTGIEFEVNSELTAQLYCSADISYARHRYDFNRNVSQDTETISKGDDIDTAPRWLGNLRLGFKPNVQWLLELEWRHMGEYYADAANTIQYPGHNIGIARAEWRVLANSAVHFRIDNIGNTRYAERADYAFGNERYFPGEERTLFIGFSASYE
jgi:outer membrane receptor protein involved in Fe transport